MSNEIKLSVPCYIRLSKWHIIFSIIIIINFLISPIAFKTKLYVLLGLIIYNTSMFFLIQRIKAITLIGDRVKVKGLFGKTKEFDLKETTHFDFGSWNTYIHYNENGENQRFRVFCNREHITNFCGQVTELTGHKIEIKNNTSSND